LGVSVVVATRNRRERLLGTLARLRALPERPPIVVVDNASSDGTPAAVRRRFPGVDLIALDANAGPAARTIGARAADGLYVAFSDDDSWCAPGALQRASELLEAFPSLALVAARVLVGERELEDETTAAMAQSPLAPDVPLPGPPVLGFIACGAIVRRSAFLDVGGFREPGMGFEETLLAVELVEAGWQLAYVPTVVAHHHPVGGRPSARRRSHGRNVLWFAWTRRPVRVALARTAAMAAGALRDPALRAALRDFLADFGRVRRQRRVVGSRTERALRRLGH